MRGLVIFQGKIHLVVVFSRKTRTHSTNALSSVVTQCRVVTMSSEYKCLCWNLNYSKSSLNTCSHPRGQNQRELRMQNIHSLRQSSQTGICTGCSCTFPRCCILEKDLRSPGNEQWSLRSGSCLFGRPPILGCAEEIAKRLKTLGLNSCELDNYDFLLMSTQIWFLIAVPALEICNVPWRARKVKRR